MTSKFLEITAYENVLTEVMNPYTLLVNVLDIVVIDFTRKTVTIRDYGTVVVMDEDLLVLKNKLNDLVSI